MNGYYDAVKANLIRIIPGTNSERGFSDADYQWLAGEYPQFAVSREQVEAGSVASGTAATTPDAAPTDAMDAAAGAVVGGAAGAAAMSSGTRRTVMIGAGGLLAGAIFFIGNVIFGGNAQTPANLQTADPGSEIVVPSDDLARDALSLGSDASGDGDSGTQSNSDGDSGAQAPGQSDGSQDDDETAQVPQGLDPRAHVVSVTPHVTGDGRHGFIVGFSEAWDGAPVLYSFFVELVAYIQANHFLPDNVVDIFWGDFSITCVEDNGLWRVRSDEIVGTSFLKFQGEAIS